MSLKKRNDSATNPVGRPSKYKPEYADMLYEHMAEGKSFESFGGRRDIKTCRDTLYEWAKKHPEFTYAKNCGYLASMLWWEDLGQRGAKGEYIAYNATTWVFTMKCRFKLMEPQPVAPSEMTKEELYEMAKEMVAEYERNKV